MILIALIIISVFLVGLGGFIIQPQLIMKLINRKYYCNQCRIDITNSEKCRLDFSLDNRIESREV